MFRVELKVLVHEIDTLQQVYVLDAPSPCDLPDVYGLTIPPTPVPTAAALGTAVTAGMAASMALADPAQAADISGTAATMGGDAAVELAAAGASAMAATKVLRNSGRGGENRDSTRALPHIPMQYDPKKIAAYFAPNPQLRLRRAMQIGSILSGFVGGLLLDFATGALRRNQKKRAKQLKLLLTKLGPVFIKIAQALSIRVDVFPAAYIAEMATLQDKVEPFPTSQAMEVLQRRLAQPIDEVFDEISSESIAAASLGQVYKARLKGEDGRPGEWVAIKVQRPGVRQITALDLHVMRGVCVALSSIPFVTTDVVAILDNWADRFFDELDYRKEAANTIRFSTDMQQLDGVVVPKVFEEYCAWDILVTQWIDGESLATSEASDVRELATTVLNAYLIQLMETGFLHADPHPGNLLRTPDGKVCILDYGLMTEVTTDQQYALVEYIAHLSAAQFDLVAQDMVKLGFVTEDSVEEVLPMLGGILTRLMFSEDGSLKINMRKIMEDLESLAYEYADQGYPIVIPPWFALVLRSFATIEGIGIKSDPEYAIVEECFPYLSRRLLKDDSPRMRAALRDLLYGEKQRVDVERLQQMVQGLSKFTTEGQKQVDPATGQVVRRRRGMDSNVKEALEVLFDPRGNYVQELLIDEAVAAVDAMSRQGLIATGRFLVTTARTPGNIGSDPNLVRALGPLRPLLFPATLPGEVMASTLSMFKPAVALSQEDEEALGVVRAVWGIFSGAVQNASGSMDEDSAGTSLVSFEGASQAVGSSVDTMVTYAPLMPSLLPGMQRLVLTFQSKLLRRIISRLTNDFSESLMAPGSA